MRIDNAQLRDQLIEHLSQFVTEERRARIEEVLAQRTRHITVVLEDLYQTQNISAVMRSCECYGIQDVYVVVSSNGEQISKVVKPVLIPSEMTMIKIANDKLSSIDGTLTVSLEKRV